MQALLPQPTHDEDLERQLEKQPLLKKDVRKSMEPIEEEDYVEEDNPESGCTDTMTYSNVWLKSWSVFLVFKHSTWDNSSLWHMMGRLALLSLVVAILLYFLIREPAQLDPSKFNNIVTLLNTFVSVMLGFFLSESISRWSNCVDGFLMLFNSIRNLSMQFHALGANFRRHDQCIRYGVLSAFFLHHELKRKNLRPEHQTQAEMDMWKKLEQNRATLQASGSKRYVTEKEQRSLEEVHDCPGQMWLWVASLVGRMAQDGDVPSMSSSTYGRILDLCQAAQDGVRRVRANIFVKLPFVYVHTLATLVHITNILLAISLGFTLGSCSTGLVHYARSYGGNTTTQTSEVLPVDYIQTIIVQIIKCTAGPILYQAFLEVGCSISCPFNHPNGAIPVIKMLQVLERDLDDSNRLADNSPAWKKPGRD